MAWEYRLFFRPTPGTPRLAPEAGMQKKAENSEFFWPHSPQVCIKGSGPELKLKSLVTGANEGNGYQFWGKGKNISAGHLDHGLAKLGFVSLPALPKVNISFVSFEGRSRNVTVEESYLEVRCGRDPPEHWRSILVGATVEPDGRPLADSVRASIAQKAWKAALPGTLPEVCSVAEFVFRRAVDSTAATSPMPPMPPTPPSLIRSLSENGKSIFEKAMLAGQTVSVVQLKSGDPDRAKVETHFKQR